MWLSQIENLSQAANHFRDCASDIASTAHCASGHMLANR
jgi:hypothetical protein